jgi:hypothetical protein
MDDYFHCKTNQPTGKKKKRPSRKTNNHQSCQAISRHLFVPSARQTQSKLTQYLISTLVIYSHHHIVLQIGLFPSAALTQNLHASIILRTRATCPASRFLLPVNIIPHYHILHMRYFTLFVPQQAKCSRNVVTNTYYEVVSKICRTGAAIYTAVVVRC